MHRHALRSSTEEASEALWMHAPRCLRRGNFEVTLLESVAFDSELQDQAGRAAAVVESLSVFLCRVGIVWGFWTWGEHWQTDKRGESFT